MHYSILIGLKNKIARNEFNLYGRTVVYGKYNNNHSNVHYTSNNNTNTSDNTHHLMNGRSQNKKNRYLWLKFAV